MSVVVALKEETMATAVAVVMVVVVALKEGTMAAAVVVAELEKVTGSVGERSGYPVSG